MNVLRPSEQIEAKYRTQIVQTADGDVIIGVITKESDQFVELSDVENKAHRVMKEDIEFRKASEVSLMPERLLETLTMQQARDLIEYLHSLR
jgi:putative heme-binding domain-containing protein